MSQRHRIEPGECLSSLAVEHGFRWETLWAHPENATLREARQSPYVLLPGDEVFIPDLRERYVPCATAKRHVFKRHGIPEQFRVRLCHEDIPRAGLPYVLEVDGRKHQQGKTDGDGWVQSWIPPAARRARLVITANEAYELSLGGLDPVSSERGLFARLRNLGFVPLDNEYESAVYTALVGFQRAHGLPPIGRADDATRAQVLAAHGS